MAKVTAFVALRVERPRVHGGDAWLPSDRTRAFAAVMTTCGLSCPVQAGPPYLFPTFPRKTTVGSIAQIAPSITRRTRRRSTIYLVAVAEETVDCHYCALSSGEIFAPSSITCCLSANLSAASLFENVATTRPFASSILTSNLNPSWATKYVLMVGINLHRPSGLQPCLWDQARGASSWSARSKRPLLIYRESRESGCICL